MDNRSDSIFCKLAALSLLLAPVPLLLSGCGQQRDPAQADTWRADDLQQLVRLIDSAAAEGLNPADYHDAALRDAVQSHRMPAEVTAMADEAALSLAEDFAQGRVKDRTRFDWSIESPKVPRDLLGTQLRQARANGQLAQWLTGLLPVSPQYQALKAMLAQLAPADPRRASVLANLERWRWMPREPAPERMLRINVPAQRVDLIDHGAVRASFAAVVGAPDTPTPALAARANAIIVNPWWNVPASILAKGELREGDSADRKGFVFERNASGTLRAKQKPGEANSLGRLKIQMPNPHAIYLHDTPAKGLFGAIDRARSHGCIRVQNIESLAETLVGNPQPIVDALAQMDTRSIALAQRWPVRIVYFTLDFDTGGRLTAYPDIYQRDALMVMALQGKPLPPPPPPPAEIAPSSGDPDWAPATTTGAEPIDYPAESSAHGAPAAEVAPDAAQTDDVDQSVTE